MCIDRSSSCSRYRFFFEDEKVNRIVRGTVYTKYVYTVPVPAVNADFL